MESVIMMCRLKWKLWFLTVTFGCLLLTSSLNEVEAFQQIHTGSNPNTILGSNSQVHNHHEAEAVKYSGISTTQSKSNEERGTKSKSKLTGDENPIGFAAEWEYKGSGLHELDEPSETKHQKQPSETQSRKIKPGLKMDQDHVPYPSPSPGRRTGSGTWLDSNGYWWLFGGQGPSATVGDKNQTAIHYLSDLWVYGPPQPQATSTSEASSSETDQIPYWRLVYRPESSGESPLSSHPENVVFPLLCGSERSGHLSLFRGQPKDSSRPLGTETHNSMFTDDSVVWLYDIPPSFENIPRRTIKSGGGSACNWSGKDRSCNGTEGLWTSYICCDACLPDGNTTFDFCPQFSREPILWCNQDSLMTFQLALTTSKSETQGKQPTSSSSSTFVPKNEIPGESQQRNNIVGDSNVESRQGESLSTPMSHISENITKTGESMKNESNSQGVGQQQWSKAERGIGGENEEKTSTTTITNGKSPKPDIPLAVPIELKEQETKDGMNNNKELKMEINTKKVLNGKTTTTEMQEGTGRLVVNWWKFDLTLTEWVKMPEVNISKEGAEEIQSGSCRTVSDQDFLYILCPTKNLLDRSVLLFDPSKRSILSLGTIHLNNAFHDKKVWHLGRSVFYALRSDNQTVIFLAYHKLLDLWIHDHSSNRLYAVENVWKGSSAMYAFQHTSSFYKLTIVLPSSSSFTDDNNGQRATSTREAETKKLRTHSFYMANPRSKLFTFDDPFPDGHFQITIVTDRAVFLPSRDARYLINSTDSNHKSVFNPENTDSAQNLSSSSASALTTNASAIKYDQHPSARVEALSPVESWNHNGEMGLKKGFPINESSVAEEMTTETVTGLRKVQGSSSISTTEAADPFTTTNTTRGAAGTRIPDSVVVAMASQSKSNATLRTYNKTNNSRLRPKADLKKRILGIKRTFSETKIDSASPSLATDSSRIISTSTSTTSTSHSSSNTIRSKTSRSSLQVNNESNRKPLSTFSPANSTGMPRVMKVLNENPTHRVASEKAAFPYRNKNTTMARITEANLDEVNLSVSPQVSALRVAVQAEQSPQTLQSESLPATLGTKIDQANIWIQPKNSSSTLAYTRSKQEADENYNLDDHPNLENNYVSHSHSPLSSSSGSDFPKKNESSLVMTTHYNASFVGDMDTDLNPLTYGSSEILIDSPNDDIQSIEAQEGSSSSYSSLGSLLFFSLSLSLFGSFGLVLFFRRCVKCPPRNESVLLKEPPPIHYSVVPDELSFHMPIV